MLKAIQAYCSKSIFISNIIYTFLHHDDGMLLRKVGIVRAFSPPCSIKPPDFGAPERMAAEKREQQVQGELRDALFEANESGKMAKILDEKLGWLMIDDDWWLVSDDLWWLVMIDDD